MKVLDTTKVGAFNALVNAIQLPSTIYEAIGSLILNGKEDVALEILETKNLKDLGKHQEDLFELTASKSCHKILKYLVENCKENIMLTEGLWRVVLHDDNEMTEYLLKNGANANGVKEDGAPLWYACKHGNLECLKILIKYGANVNIKEGAGLTIAAEDGHINIVKYLVENGVDLEKNNNMALNMAKSYMHTEIVEYLEEKIENESYKC